MNCPCKVLRYLQLCGAFMTRLVRMIFLEDVARVYDRIGLRTISLSSIKLLVAIGNFCCQLYVDVDLCVSYQDFEATGHALWRLRNL